MKSPAARWIRRGVLVVAAFAVLDYLILPQIAGTQKAIGLLGSIRPWWAITGAGLEVLSLMSYSRLSRSMFPSGGTSYFWVLRSDVTSLGVSHLLPFGTATSTALRYRLLHQGGVPPEDVVVGMAVEAVGSNLLLAAMLWVALVASIPLVGPNDMSASAAALGVALAASTPVAILVHARYRAQTSQWLRSLIRRLPARLVPRVEHAYLDAGVQIRRLLADKRKLRTAVAWSFGNWILDAGSLWVFLAAYGSKVNPENLMIAYGLANVAAILPISPGGLGVIEGILIPTLVGFGTPSAVAVLGVVSWRLFNFWAPIPSAGACYLSLRSQLRRDSGGVAVPYAL